MEERAECNGESPQEPNEFVSMGMDWDWEIYGCERFEEGNNQIARMTRHIKNLTINASNPHDCCSTNSDCMQ